MKGEKALVAGEKQSQGFEVVSMEKSAEMAATASAARAKAQVEAAFIMAERHPRNEADARAEIIKLCKTPDFARKAIYQKPVGGETIEGPSIRLAEQIIRFWRNIGTDIETTYEDERSRKINVTVRDLQGNNYYSQDAVIDRTIERRDKAGRVVLSSRMNKSGQVVYIVQATEDEMMVKTNATTSKIIRNQGLRHIPEDVIAEAVRTARKTLLDKAAKDPNAERKSILDGFAEIGILPSEIEAMVRVPVEKWNADNLVTLRQVLTAIQEKVATWSDFAVAATEEGEADAIDPKAKLKQLKQAAKDKASGNGKAEQGEAGEVGEGGQANDKIVQQVTDLHNALMESPKGKALLAGIRKDFKLSPNAIMPSENLSMFLVKLKEAHERANAK